MTDQNYFVLNGTVKKVLDLQTKRDKITVAYPSDEEALFKGFNASLPIHQRPVLPKMLQR